MKKLSKLFVAVAGLALVSGALVACGGTKTSGSNNSVSAPAVPAELKDAYDFVNALYKNEGENTPTNYARPTRVTVGDLVFPITWTAESTPAGAVTIVPVADNDLQVMVTFDEMTTVEIVYTLKAEISTPNGGAKVTLTWNRKVPAFKENTWAEYEAAAKDTQLVVKGVVTAILSKTAGNSSNSLYLEDTDGGYYAYNMADEASALGISVGDTVRVVGKKDIYSGTHEIVPTKVEKLDVAKTTITPADYTDVFKAAADTKAEALVKKQAKLVTVKGVTIKTAGDNGYYNWELNGKTSYTRISSSSCPLSKADQTTFINEFNAHQGWVADVTGLVTVYNGAFYLTPVDANAIKYVSLPQLGDKEAVEFEKNALTCVEEITKAGSYDVATKGGAYEKVAITWASANEEVVKFEAGKMVVTMPSETKEVKVTATLKAGTVTDTKEFTVKVIVSNSFVAQACAVAEGLESGKSTTDKYMVIGTVGKIVTAYSEQYKNVSFEITDGARSIQIYRYALEDAADVKVGDFFALQGTLKNYKGTLEMENAEKIANAMSCKAANDAALAGNKGEAVVYGQVNKINTAYSDQYNNISFTINDGTGDFYCYRVAGGSDLALGDWVVVTGNLTTYKEAAQMNAGGKYTADPKVAAATGGETGGETGGTTEVKHAGTEADPYTPEEAVLVAKDFENSTSTTAYGTVKEVYVKGIMADNGNDKGNYVQSFNLGSKADTKSLLVFTANKLKKDNVNVDMFQNDEIVIHGYLMKYNGTIEISNWKKSSTENLYPEVKSVTTGTSTISVGAKNDAKATVTLDKTSGKNGETFTFSVTVASGNVIDTVKANGADCKLEGGKYSATIKGNTEVVVTTKAEGASTPALPFNTQFVNTESTWALPEGWTSEGSVAGFASNKYTALKAAGAYVQAKGAFLAPSKGILVSVDGVVNNAEGKTCDIEVVGLNDAGEVVATSEAQTWTGVGATNAAAVEASKTAKTFTVTGANITGVRVVLKVRNANFVLAAVNVSAQA